MKINNHLKGRNYIVFFLLLGLFSCKQKNNEEYLYCGLKGYNKIRYVNEEFVKGYEVLKVAFLKESNQKQYVLLLKGNVENEIVKKYSLGVHAHTQEAKDVLVWDIKPETQKYGGNKYIIGAFKHSIEKVDSLVFFLYDRNEYQGIKGNRIVINNIKI